MAGLRFTATTIELLSFTAVKTLLQILAPAAQRVEVWELAVAFKGISNTDAPILVDVLRQTSAGTPGGDGGALTLVKWDNAYAEAIQTTAQKGRSNAAAWTVEPTAGDILFSQEVHPQSGYGWVAPFDTPIIIPGGGRLGIRVTAAVSVTAVARMRGEE